MTWFRRFPGLSIFLGLCLLGAIALLVLIVMASGGYSQISTQYEDAERELGRLEGAKVYPSQKNVGLIQRERESFAGKLDDLRRQLATSSPPVEPITQNGFQDKLRAAVSAVQKLASDKSVELPEGFYLGFDQYQATLPRAEAAPVLSRQLDSFQTVVERLIQAGVSKITFIDRQPLPVEEGAEAAGDALYTKQKVELGFVSTPETLRQAVNAIAQHENFLVLRTLSIRNENQAGPSKTDTARTAAAAPGLALSTDSIEALFGGGEPAGGGPEQTSRLEFVVGQEKVETALQIEIVRIPPPAADDQPAQPAS